jgi:acetolactate synthase-1/2/3 large subunit
MAGPVERTGGEILVDQLRLHGADTVFGVPGESFLAALDAMHDRPVRFVICRMEAGAANAADAYGKLTGRPGICFVTRAPGATHASVGVHTARQDSTPLILLIGQVARADRGKEAFQEVDYEAMFAPLAKWAVEVDDPARLPEIMARAFHVATSGRPGPVVVSLPEDVLLERVAVADAAPYAPARPGPAAAELDEALALLAEAERPLLVVGGGGWSAEIAADAVAFAEAHGIPVVTSFRRQDYIDWQSPSAAGYIGIGMTPQSIRLAQESDLVLAVGARLDDATTGGYTLFAAPEPRQRLIHVYPDADELGRVYRPTLGIVASAGPFLAAALAHGRPAAAAGSPARAAWTEAAHAGFVASLEPPTRPFTLDLGQVVTTMRELLPADAILTNGAGNYSVWWHRYWPFPMWPTQLAPTSGAMGYGLPAAIAAKLLHPERTVVCLAGDGDFLMTGQELATATAEGLAFVTVVVNNGMYGTIRMHQEREYPGREVGTRLVNPDFALFARSFGGHGEIVTCDDEFGPALQRCLAFDGPSLIELQVDPEAITPRTTIAELRAGGGRSG